MMLFVPARAYIDKRRLAAAIRDRRLQLDLSQEDLAKKADMTASYVFKLEEARVNRPGGEMLFRLRDALAYPTVEVLVMGDGVVAPDQAATLNQTGVDTTLAEIYEKIRQLEERAADVPIYQWGAAARVA